MTIGELAARSGVPASTLRYWEQIGVLPRAVRVSGRRRYGVEAVERVGLLRLAQEGGFRLEEIRQLWQGFPEGEPAGRRWRVLVAGKRRETEDEIRRLMARRELLTQLGDCACEDLGECGRWAVAWRP